MAIYKTVVMKNGKKYRNVVAMYYVSETKVELEVGVKQNTSNRLRKNNKFTIVNISEIAYKKLQVCYIREKGE